MQDSATGKQTSLRTKDETQAKSLLEARNAAQRQSVLNLHLARAYLTASDPAFVERTWQTVMEQLQSRGKDTSKERYPLRWPDRWRATFRRGGKDNDVNQKSSRTGINHIL